MYEEYYRELNPEKRKKILDALTSLDEKNSELDHMQKLFGLRYKKSAKGVFADQFLQYWLELKMAAKNADSYVSARRTKKQVVSAWHMLCLDRVMEFDRDILYREMCHLTRLYITLCSQDESYNAFLWGLGRISEEKRKDKMIRDLELIGEEMPKSFDLEKEFEILKSAIRDTRIQLL